MVTQMRCVSNGDVNCSQANPLLISALDQFNHPEIQNSNDADSCTQGEEALAPYYSQCNST